jgi:hypothetical protein
MRRGGAYCRVCSNAYHAWRQATKDFEASTGVPQVTSVGAFRYKYLRNELTSNPPQQWEPDAKD